MHFLVLGLLLFSLCLDASEGRPLLLKDQNTNSREKREILEKLIQSNNDAIRTPVTMATGKTESIATFPSTPLDHKRLSHERPMIKMGTAATEPYTMDYVKPQRGPLIHNR